jgi:hypothetical protein
MPEGGTKITIDSYQDWLNGEFEDLFKNGKITTVVTAASASAANKQQTTRRANESKEV